MNIKIKIAGKNTLLTLAEAKELYEELRDLFETDDTEDRMRALNQLLINDFELNRCLEETKRIEAMAGAAMSAVVLNANSHKPT